MDLAVFRAVNTKLAGPLLDQLMLFVSSKWTWLAVGVALVVYVAIKRSLSLASFTVLIGIAIGVSDGVAYQLLKPTFQRERPCHQYDDVRVVQDRCGSDYGFPSNHASNGMAVATVVALVFRSRKIAALFFGSALLVGFSRVYLGVHFPGDVLCGFLFGGVAGTLTYFAYRATLARVLPLPVITARP